MDEDDEGGDCGSRIREEVVEMKEEEVETWVELQVVVDVIMGERWWKRWRGWWWRRW